MTWSYIDVVLAQSSSTEILFDFKSISMWVLGNSVLQVDNLFVAGLKSGPRTMEVQTVSSARKLLFVPFCEPNAEQVCNIKAWSKCERYIYISSLVFRKPSEYVMFTPFKVVPLYAAGERSP